MSTLLDEDQEMALYDALNEAYSKDVGDAGKMLFNNVEKWVLSSEDLILGGPQATAATLARACAAVVACICMGAQKAPMTDNEITDTASQFSVLVYKECELQLRTVMRIYKQREKRNV